MNEYPRESVELQKVKVTVDSVVVTVGVKFAIAKVGERPEAWHDSIAIGSEIGVMVEGLEEGHYEVFAKIDSPPEVPVIRCGTLKIT